jgi:two-component system response regulator YesN
VTKLLIVDDEPLVCVGLRSMLKWEIFGIEIAGTARNGQQAAEMIENIRPDIVITDIKMPLKNGLELAEECGKKYGQIPLFIILTSFEEFQYVRRALGIQAVDYLIKLELSPESLEASIRKALAMLEQISKAESAGLPSQRNIQGLREKFFLRLYNNLFESREQYLAQKEELGLDFSFPAYVAVSGEIENNLKAGDEKSLTLYGSSIQMVQETLEKKRPCYLAILDSRHFTITFCLENTGFSEQMNILEEELGKTIAIVFNYFNVSLRMGVGSVVEDPLRLDESYLAARRAFRSAPPGTPLCVFRQSFEESKEDFAFSKVRPEIRRAFEELDTNALYNVLTGIAAHFENRPDLRVEAMDAVCNILYMAISLLPEGEQTLEAIFSEDEDGYRGIYRIYSTDAVIEWLLKLRDGCCETLLSRRQNYKQQIVANVQDYIRRNLEKRLSLHGVAAVFNFSPNYLSQLFTRYGNEGFVGYITRERINAAKEMFVRKEYRIYEVAERLGYESAFYFSKVFKKETGISPREFLRRLENNNRGNNI